MLKNWFHLLLFVVTSNNIVVDQNLKLVCTTLTISSTIVDTHAAIVGTTISITITIGVIKSSPAVAQIQPNLKCEGVRSSLF